MRINFRNQKVSNKGHVLSLLLLAFFISAFSIIKSEKERLPQKEKVTDSVITDLSKIRWSEVQKFSARDGELSANLKNGDSILISRKAYVKYASENNKVDTDYQKVFTKMEVEPEYPGGEKAWLKYLKDSLNYPDQAMSTNTEFSVVIQFKVDVEGNISNITPLSGFGRGLIKEAIRIVKESGKWNPGIQNFRIVNALVIKPVVFKKVKVWTI